MSGGFFSPFFVFKSSLCAFELAHSCLLIFFGSLLFPNSWPWICSPFAGLFSGNIRPSAETCVRPYPLSIDTECSACCCSWMSCNCSLAFLSDPEFLNRVLLNFKVFGFAGLNFCHSFSVLLLCGQKTEPVQFLLFGTYWDFLCGLIYDLFL